MKRVKIAELKAQLSRHLRSVENGEEIEVTDRDRPIVRIVPVRAPEAGPRIRKAERPVAEMRNQRPKPVPWAKDALAALIADRRRR